MKEQQIIYITPSRIKELNEQGWVIKKVIERHQTISCKEDGYYVLLEKEEQPKTDKLKAECWEMYLKKPNEVRFVIVYLTSTINADYKDYCLVVDENYKLTQEEFDKLKRGLENES